MGSKTALDILQYSVSQLTTRVGTSVLGTHEARYVLQDQVLDLLHEFRKNQVEQLVKMHKFINARPVRSVRQMGDSQHQVMVNKDDVVAYVENYIDRHKQFNPLDATEVTTLSNATMKKFVEAGETPVLPTFNVVLEYKSSKSSWTGSRTVKVLRTHFDGCGGVVVVVDGGDYEAKGPDSKLRPNEFSSCEIVEIDGVKTGPTILGMDAGHSGGDGYAISGIDPDDPRGLGEIITAAFKQNELSIMAKEPKLVIGVDPAAPGGDQTAIGDQLHPKSDQSTR